MLVIVVSVEVVRIYFGRQGRTKEPLKATLESVVVGLLSFAWLVGLLGWIILPNASVWARLEVPLSVRYGGVVLGVASAGLLIWVHRSLGANFSSVVRISDAHELVVHGPYRLARHPMYSSFVPLMLSYVLISESAYIAVTSVLLMLALLRIRVPREEQVLIRHFGDAYRAYMQRTGSLWPKRRRSSH